MKLIGMLFIVSLKAIYIENRMLPINIVTMSSNIEEFESTVDQIEENPNDKVIGLKNYEARYQNERNYEIEKKRFNEVTKKPCAIVVLSNIQHPSVQSLLRKYRYNADGILIPSSVQYFIKLPQGLQSPPVLVPLNDKAFSPLGGFVRYYKEVPPIPQTW